jgi:PIN like domain
MRVLVDEGMPVQILGPLRQNRGHAFDHIDDLKWKGRPDQPLFEDASGRGYDAILTLDVNQLSDADECRALRQSGLHHISLQQGRTVRGLKGLARVIASVVAAMPYVLEDLEEADGQRVVELTLLAAARRHATYDPRKELGRFPYWR